jgi:hypothetical protein
MEDWFWQNVEKKKTGVCQPDFVRRHVIANWMMFAWGRGDETVKLYNNNKPLFEPYVTYERI